MASGLKSQDFAFRFGTKLLETETDLIHYQFRSYSSKLGKWLNRDRIEEKGGLCLYAYVQNDPVDFFDHFGLFPPHLPDDCPCTANQISAAKEACEGDKKDAYDACVGDANFLKKVIQVSKCLQKLVGGVLEEICELVTEEVDEDDLYDQYIESNCKPFLDGDCGGKYDCHDFSP
jgi:RHS repeat-associated protein